MYITSIGGDMATLERTTVTLARRSTTTFCHTFNTQAQMHVHSDLDNITREHYRVPTVGVIDTIMELVMLVLRARHQRGLTR